MSWYGGSHTTTRLSSECPKKRWISPRLCSRLACVSITPRGLAVEPEVYWRKASAAPPRGPGVHASAIASATSAVASQRTASSEGVRRAISPDASSSSGVVSASAGRASARIASSRSSERFCRGGYTGTAAPPAGRGGGGPGAGGARGRAPPGPPRGAVRPGGVPGPRPPPGKQAAEEAGDVVHPGRGGGDAALAGPGVALEERRPRPPPPVE